ncbi:hypothetical protein B0E44_12715 [Flavobacterium sp. A45]|nr:hypothetical protein B0E44_12715 [Flavobacterium sp. A45]
MVKIKSDAYVSFFIFFYEKEFGLMKILLGNLTKGRLYTVFYTLKLKTFLYFCGNQYLNYVQDFYTSYSFLF